MVETKLSREIGECLCLLSPYKHFIMTSLEESIENRDKEIDIIRKARKELIKIRGIKSSKDADAMIEVHKHIKEELINVRNMVGDIHVCR